MCRLTSTTLNTGDWFLNAGQQPQLTDICSKVNHASGGRKNTHWKFLQFTHPATDTAAWAVIQKYLCVCVCVCKDKGHPNASLHGIDGRQMYCSSSFATSALWGGGWWEPCTSRIHSFIHSLVFSLKGRAWQEPEPSHVTGMALAHCILGKYLGVVCHCFPPPLDVPTLAVRCQ